MISDEDEIYLHTHNRSGNSSNSEEDNEWEFEDDDIILEENSDNSNREEVDIQQQQQQQQYSRKSPPPPSSIYKNLSHQDYIEEISIQTKIREYYTFICKITPIQINERFFSTISTSFDAANDLRTYYLSRPQLFNYTLNAELHRMDYTVKDSTDDGSNIILTNGNDIKERYNTRDDLLIWRAANQSLLADAIQCLTGSDNIIRPQYLATAIANKCHFILDIKDETITCDCSLTLSFPMENGRLEIADLQIQIYFHLNDIPELNIKLIDITPRLDIKDDDLIAVSMLLSEQGMVDFDDEQYQDNQQQKSSNNFRDALTNTKTGMSSTLRQMNDIVNVKSKLGFFSSLLPSADLLAAAEEDTANTAVQFQHQHVPLPLSSSSNQQFDNNRNNRISMPLENLATITSTTTTNHHIHRPNPLDKIANHNQQPYCLNPLDNLANHHQQQEYRPSTTNNPLLGGMVRNLITSAASNNAQVPQREKPIRLYNLENKKSKSPSSSPLPPSSSPLRLYNIEEVKQPITSSSTFTKNEDKEVVSNGWSDDEFDYLDDVEGKEDPIINSSISPVCTTSSITKVFNDHDTIILNHEYDIIPTRKRWNRCAVMIR